MASSQPLSLDQLAKLFESDQAPSIQQIREILLSLANDYQGRGIELKEVASGYRFQVSQDLAPFIQKLWQERPSRYSRALLETLALIVYRQPITRAEIEEIRGVVVSSTIIKTLLEREWVKIVGHKEVPGKPALYATTKQFLDDFNLKTLSELPPLSELQDFAELEAKIEVQLQLPVMDSSSLNEQTLPQLDETESDIEISSLVETSVYDEAELETEQV